MIHEVDLALRALIEREAAAGTEVEVVFDAPTKDWAGRRNVPTIDVYLYDIREDLRRRERGLINEYDARNRVSARHLPPRHFKLSYLVTAWTQRPEDEHRLLAALLSCFLRHDALPGDLITGPLAEMGLPVPVTVALPPPEDRSFADVWSALGGELKPSLDVVVSAPTDTGQVFHAGPPVVKPSAISLGGVGAWPPREVREETPDRFAAAGRAAAEARLAAIGTGGTPDDEATEAAMRELLAVGGEPGTGASGSAAASASGAPKSSKSPTSSIRQGMSWGEFAHSGSPPGSAGGSDSDQAGAPGSARTGSARASGAATKTGKGEAAAGPAAGTARARRRRSGGISQK